MHRTSLAPTIAFSTNMIVSAPRVSKSWPRTTKDSNASCCGQTSTVHDTTTKSFFTRSAYLDPSSVAFLIRIAMEGRSNASWVHSRLSCSLPACP